MPRGPLLAAIDLGSNTFRLEAAHALPEGLEPVLSLQEPVRQGFALDAQGNLAPEALERGWDCLARFARELAALRPARVRAVATQGLRDARNREVFLRRARALLDCPVDLISGHEEARLIYAGVTGLLPACGERRLVVDVGGRSTELVVGRGHEAEALASCALGSVAWSMRFFGTGAFSADAFDAAEAAARDALAPALARLPRAGWDVAYGASGTVGAVADVLRTRGDASGGIDRACLDTLRAELLSAGHVQALRLPGLQEAHRPLIAGGLAVLRGVFDALALTRLQPAAGALRHGVLCALREQLRAGGASASA